MSTLVIHPGPLGDLLLAIPALRALRAAAPADSLGLAAQPRLGGLLQALGVVDRCLDFEGLGLAPLFVQNGSAPAVQALRGVARLVSWFGARDPVFTGQLRELAPGAIVASPTGDGAVAVWQHLLMTLDAPAGPWCQSLVVPRPVAEAGRTRLMSAGWDGRSPLLILHPGAGSAGKRWPVEGFVGVIAALRAGRRVTILMIEGPADRDAVSALQSRLDRQVLRGLTLPELAGALSHATAYLGNDSGPSHLAAAVGTAAVILFTAANQAWRPWSAAAWPITVTTTRLVPGDVARVRDRLAASMG